MKEPWHYRAYALDPDGNTEHGIEEEFLARNQAEAISTAWRRARQHLELITGTLYMEVIKRGPAPASQFQFPPEEPNDG